MGTRNLVIFGLAMLLGMLGMFSLAFVGSGGEEMISSARLTMAALE